MMRRVRVLFAVTASMLLLPALAGEGNIPVYQPTRLDAPGHYVVTRDFEATEGNAISIASVGVVLDLNGHTVSTLDPDGSVVSVGLFGLDPGVVRIHNGRVIGGRYGIDTHSAKEIYIDHVEIRDSSIHGIELNSTRYFEVTSCSMISTGTRGMNASNSSEWITGRVVDNFVSGATELGILLTSFAHGQVSGNVIELTGSTSHGIGIQDSFGLKGGANRIAGNRITHEGSNGINLGNSSGGNFVVDNVIRFVGTGSPTGSGVDVGCPDNLLARNVVSGHIYGFRVLADRNHLEGNKAFGNDWGLYFAVGTDTTYRDNVLLGNRTAPVGGNALGDAIDGGGNIP